MAWARRPRTDDFGVTTVGSPGVASQLVVYERPGRSSVAGSLLARHSFPKEHWRQLWSNNSLERLNREIRRRTDVVGIFPDRASITRLVGALLAEQHDEWAVCRRYMSVESIAKALADPPIDPEEVNAIEAVA